MEMVYELFPVWWHIFSKRENTDMFVLIELPVFTMSLLVVNLQRENFEMDISKCQKCSAFERRPSKGREKLLERLDWTFGLK